MEARYQNHGMVLIKRCPGLHELRAKGKVIARGSSLSGPNPLCPPSRQDWEYCQSINSPDQGTGREVKEKKDMLKLDKKFRRFLVRCAGQRGEIADVLIAIPASKEKEFREKICCRTEDEGITDILDEGYSFFDKVDDVRSSYPELFEEVEG